MTDRPQIPDTELDKPIGGNMSDREPLELLPEREWLNATIKKCELQIAMFNNEINYFTDQEGNIINGEDGLPIARKEFNITFELRDYALPNGDPRKAWLKLGASMGEKSHLPTFLYNVLDDVDKVQTFRDVTTLLPGKDVKLQLKNRQSKDGSKTYQNVVWDAVKVDRDPKPSLAPDGCVAQRVGMNSFFDYKGKKVVKWSVIDRLLELGEVRVNPPSRKYSGDSKWREQQGMFQAKEGR